MYKLGIVLLLCLSVKLGIAQQLVFTNASTKKEIRASVGSMLYLTYNGYNGQHEYAMQAITEITDSTVTIGLSPVNLFGKKRYNASANSYKVIYLKDITAFRKRSVGGIVLNGLVNVGGVVGSVFLLNDLISKNNISTGNAFLISLGAGLVVRYGTLLVFPVNAKHKMSDGWSVKASPALD